MEKLTTQNIKTYLKELKELDFLKNRTLLHITTTGSSLYGINGEVSDYDFTVLYLPTRKDLFEYNIEKVSFSDKFQSSVFGETDVSIYDIRFFLDLSTKSTVNVVPLHLGFHQMNEMFLKECGETVQEYLGLSKEVTEIFDYMYSFRESMTYFNLDFLHASLGGYMYQTMRSFKKDKSVKQYVRFLYLKQLSEHLGKTEGLDKFYCLEQGNELQTLRLSDKLPKEYSECLSEMELFTYDWKQPLFMKEFHEYVGSFVKEHGYTQEFIEVTKKMTMDYLFKVV